MERTTEEDLALFAVDYASKLGADCVDARLEEHYNESIIVADGKVRRGVVSRKSGIRVRTLVDGAWGFESITDLSKKRIKEATGIASELAKTSSEHIPND
jgi:predicted Zn-dependent protease